MIFAALAGCTNNEGDGGLTPWHYEPTEESHAIESPVTTVDNDTGNLSIPEGVEPLRFVLIGDGGTGDEHQYAVAAAMETVCAAQGCDFVMTLGDNIYETGVTSATDIQFETKFEQPYVNLDMPFYLTLGNHDNGGAGTNQKAGQYEVDYHYRSDRSSDKWNMPDRFYRQRFGDDLEIFAIDTDSIQKDEVGLYNHQEEDPTVILSGDKYTPENQKAWVNEAIDASDANWKIAFGHYNYISNGNYGDGTAGLKSALEETVCDKVQFYAQGHDHDLQWLKPVDSCGRTEFLGSSAAGKSRSVDPDWEFDARAGVGDVYGFIWAQIVGDNFTAQFWDADENMLFEETVTKQQLGW